MYEAVRPLMKELGFPDELSYTPLVNWAFSIPKVGIMLSIENWVSHKTRGTMFRLSNEREKRQATIDELMAEINNAKSEKHQDLLVSCLAFLLLVCWDDVHC